MIITNLENIDLSLAVWLLHDDYDFVPEARAISATGLLKPTQQIVLGARLGRMVKAGEAPEESLDLASLIARRYGHAIHDSIQHSWTSGYRTAMKQMNIPTHVIDRVRINPPEPEEGTIPVYLETRGTREFMGYKISGKMDLCLNGRLKDVKTTSVWSYILGRKDQDYQLQGSLYRWLHPEKVTEEEMDIQFIFTDWKKSDARQITDYPKSRLVSYTLPLWSLDQTEAWVARKLSEIQEAWDAPQIEIPRCTDEELWRSDPVWKYYQNGNIQGRATKNFKTPAEAAAFRATKGGAGTIVHVPGQVKACGYCRAFPICKQKDEYDHE